MDPHFPLRGKTTVGNPPRAVSKWGTMEKEQQELKPVPPASDSFGKPRIHSVGIGRPLVVTVPIQSLELSIILVSRPGPLQHYKWAEWTVPTKDAT